MIAIKWKVIGNGQAPVGGETLRVVGDVRFEGSITSTGATYIPNVLKAVANTPYATAATDSIVRWDTVGGDCTQTLPAVAASTNRYLEIWDWTGNCAVHPVTIAAAGGETVNGLASIQITTAYGGACLYCDGLTWRTVRGTV